MTKEQTRRLRASQIKKVIRDAELCGGCVAVEVVQGTNRRGSIAWTTRTRTITFVEKFRGVGLPHLAETEQLSATLISGPPEAWKPAP